MTNQVNYQNVLQKIDDLKSKCESLSWVIDENGRIVFIECTKLKEGVKTEDLPHITGQEFQRVPPDIAMEICPCPNK